MFAAEDKPMSLDELIEDAQRVLRVCNACRYCEGYCAVFPALARRLEFTENDVLYLGNLCHNCGSCLYACQFAPPHEFQVNFPRLMAKARGETYRRYAWPGFLGKLYDNNAVAVSLISAFSIALLFWLAGALSNPDQFFAAHPVAQGSFYALIPHNVMAGVFGAVSIFVAFALFMGFVRFWPYMGEELSDFFKAGPLAEGVHDAMTLKNLGGGVEGEGCTYPTEQKSLIRKVFHHFTFYGFMLCFAATSVATKVARRLSRNWSMGGSVRCVGPLWAHRRHARARLAPRRGHAARECAAAHAWPPPLNCAATRSTR